MKNKVKYAVLLAIMAMLCACQNSDFENATDSTYVPADTEYNIPMEIGNMDYTYEEFEFSRFTQNEEWRKNVNSDNPDAWEGSSIVDYDEYLELCDSIDIEPEYDDDDSCYAFIYYVSYNKVHGIIGSYMETDDTVSLFLREETDYEFSDGTCAYVIVFPVSENIEAIDYYLCENGEEHYNGMLDRVSGNLLMKPVIYLYPEEETDVTVTMNRETLEFTCTYPAYNNGWNVHAFEDGTLIGENGMEYNYLYWEGNAVTDWDFSKGFCVAGEDTAAFLEEKLEMLGLSREEANEFIVYWLPLMEKNEYNVISFQQEAYTDVAQLNVSPTPDTVIRVFMTWYSSDTYVEIPEQSIDTPQRNGFTVVEWGGTEVSSN